MSQDRAFRLRRTLQVHFKTEREADWNEGVTNDLSRTGLFVVSDNPAPEGAPVLIELMLPRSEVLTLQGNVAWSNPVPAGAEGGFGLSLINPPARWDEILSAMEEVAKSDTPPPMPSAVKDLLSDLDVVLDGDE